MSKLNKLRDKYFKANQVFLNTKYTNSRDHIEARNLVNVSRDYYYSELLFKFICEDV